MLPLFFSDKKRYSVKKILLLFFCLFLAVLMAGLLFLAVYLMQWARENTRENHGKLLESYTNEIDIWVNSLYDFNLNLYTSNYDFQVLAQGGNIERQLIHENSLRNLVNYRTYKTGAIFIFDQNQTIDIYKFGSDYSARDFLEGVVLKEAILEFGRGLTIQECFAWTTFAHAGRIYLLNNFRSGNLNVCSMIDLERTAALINKDNEDGNIYFAFSAGKRFLTEAGAFAEKEAGDSVWQEKPPLNLFGNSYVLTGEELTNTNVSLCVMETLTLLNGYSRIAMVILLVVFGILTALVITVFRVMSRYLLYPLKQIAGASEMLTDTGAENTPRKLAEPGGNGRDRHFLEIEKINDALNDLVRTKVNLENENQKRQQEEEHAQLQYYQLQTRSHFFVNCLKSLYGMLEAGQYGKMQRMIIAFSNHIRYVFHDNMSTVTLREEIREVNDYHSIIAMDRMTPIIVIENIEESLMEYRVPPLSVQTFLENSFQYSRRENKSLQIVICAERLVQNEKCFLKLKISDNGEGFSRDVLERLNAPESCQFEQYHVGIGNLKRRLQLIYHQDFSIHFYNDLKGGACVVMYIPALTGQDEQWMPVTGRGGVT